MALRGVSLGVLGLAAQAGGGLDLVNRSTDLPLKTVPLRSREIRHNDLLHEEVFCREEIEVYR